MTTAYSIIVVAAGKGKRMGAGCNKLLMELEEKPVIVHTLFAIQKSPLIESVILVVGEEEIGFYQRDIIGQYGFTKVRTLVPGGEERADSVYRGFQMLDKGTRLVLVHDGARPFITGEVILRVIDGAEKTGAAVAGVPVKDTIKIANALGQVAYTPPRETLWAVQTPQAFRFDWLQEAYGQLTKGIHITDEAMLLEKMGYPVQIVMGDYENIKITTPEDLLLGEAILRKGRNER